MCFFLQVNDGVEVTKNVTYTPVTIKILNMFAGLRGALGTLVFIALFPPKVKDYNAMMRPIVDMLVDLAPGAEGLTLEDGTLIHVALAWILNDTRGVPTGCCGKQAPALIGSCVIDVVQGQRHHRSTILPGAVRLLPPNHALRADYAEEFEAYEPIAVLATLPRCNKRSHTKIVASGRRVLAGAAEKGEAFKGVSEFVRLWYHNLAKHTKYDLAHALANQVKDTIRYMMVHTPSIVRANIRTARRPTIRTTRRPNICMHNFPNILPQNCKEGWLFTGARRMYEQDTLGRFAELLANKKRKFPTPPWAISPKRQILIDELTKELEYPAGWPTVSVMFEFGGGMKTTEALLKLGPVGAYQLSFADCDPDFLKLILSLFSLLGRVMLKSTTPEERAKISKESAELFTKLEMIMPSSWNTFVRHTCCYHCCDTLEACGPFWTCNMLDHERMHTLLKQLARNRKDLFASMVNNYRYLEMSVLNRVAPENGEQGRPDLALEPRRSTPAGFAARPESSRRADGELAIRPLGTAKALRLGTEDFDMVQQLWRIAEPEYDALLTRFEQYNAKSRVADRITDLKDLPSTQRFPITEKHKKMMAMSPVVLVRPRCVHA